MKLKRELHQLDIFSLAAGTMISSGIFILPGLAYAKAGPAVVISYFLAGILALIGVLSVLELSTAMPKAGGDYYFIRKAMGPFSGTLSGILGWFALSFKTAFAIFGIAELIYIFFGTNLYLSSFLLCLFFVLLNLVGIKPAARVQSILVICLLLILAGFIIAGFPHIHKNNLMPFAPMGILPIFSTIGFVFVAFGGMLKIASLAEEVESPGKNIPRGIFYSITIITITSVLLLITIGGILEPAQFSGSMDPASDAASVILGKPGFIALSIAGLIAFVTTANAGIMAASRYPLAMSRDKLMPKFFSFLSPIRKTPVLSIVFTGLMVMTALLLPIDKMIKAASVLILTSFIMTNLSVIVIRESRLENYRPSFKVPLYPWTQIFCIAIFVLLIVDMGKEAMELSLLFVMTGVLFYFAYGRKKAVGEFALLHLMKRLTDNKITEHLLETELRDIILERDQIEPDRFDQLVKKAEILDLEGKYNLDEFFKLIAGKMSAALNLETTSVLRLLEQRQAQSSTAVSPFTAIPHIVIEDTNDFFFMLIRCKEGIYFTENEPAIKSVFVLAGSPEDRDFHLKALAAIASMSMKRDFEQKWLGAKDVHYLRDLLLLSGRKRQHDVLNH